MNEIYHFDFENPWLFIPTNVIVGIVVVSILQGVLFDGRLFSAIIEGAVLGLVCGITLYYIR